MLLTSISLISHARKPSSYPVNVVNFPGVQAIEDVNQPALQPAQKMASNFTEIDSLTVLVTGAHIDPVPADKRLVVQHVSVDMSSGNLEGDPICSIVVRVPDPFEEIILHRVPTEREDDGV